MVSSKLNKSAYITINGIERIPVNTNYNIIQVCNNNNINIPKFCYHEELSIAGNCRMCLVEVKGVNKPIASCGIPVMDNMVIYTDSKLVKKAREGILEFLLINHPLDCPICDQGGECDLQDQSLVFGSDRGRFHEYKRSVNDKDCGYLIKTIMTRCIHCTRCIRFLDEMSGFKYLGLIGRGSNIEISNYINRIIYTELSGNIIDLCPVGALTSKSYAFKARSWELNSFKTIDLNDPFHLNIRVDLRDSKVLRILPIYNNNIKENWITDLTRYCFDGYTNYRLINPSFKNNEGNMVSTSWSNVLKFMKKEFYNKNINFIIGNFIDIETALILKKLLFLNFKKFNWTVNYDNNNSFDFRSSYFFEKIKLDNILDYNNLIIININLRLINPLLSLKIKNFSKKKGLIYNIGQSFNLNYLSYNYSSNLSDFISLIEGRLTLNNILINRKSLCIINQSIIKNNFINNYIYIKSKLKSYLNIDFVSLGDVTNFYSLNEINLTNSLMKFNDVSLNDYKEKKDINIVYFLNTYSKIINSTNSLLKVYQGHNFSLNNSLSNFNILLPSVNFFEKNSNYVNLFGYYQKSKFLFYPPKNARNDWKILYLVFKYIFDYTWYYNSEIFNQYITNYNLYFNTSFFSLTIIKSKFISKFIVQNILFTIKNTSLYKNNSISGSSNNLFNTYRLLKLTYTNFS